MRWRVLGALLIFHSTLFAQKIVVHEYKERTIPIAAKEVTLIGVAGERIRSLRGVANKAWLQTDPHTGSVLLRPKVTTPLQLFISTQAAHQYALRLVPSAQKAEPLLLWPSFEKAGAETEKESEVAFLLALLRTSPKRSHLRARLQHAENLPAGLKRRLIVEWKTAGYTIKHYRLENPSAETQKIPIAHLLKTPHIHALIFPAPELAAHSQSDQYEVLR